MAEATSGPSLAEPYSAPTPGAHTPPSPSELPAEVLGLYGDLWEETMKAALRINLTELETARERIVELEKQIAAGKDGAGASTGEGDAATGSGARLPLTFDFINNRSEAFEILGLPETSSVDEIEQRFLQKPTELDDVLGTFTRRERGAVLAIASRRLPRLLLSWIQRVLYCEATVHFSLLELPEFIEAAPLRLEYPLSLFHDPTDFTFISNEADAFAALRISPSSYEAEIYSAYKVLTSHIGETDVCKAKAARGAVFILSLLHLQYRTLDTELHSSLFIEGMMHLTKFNIDLDPIPSMRLKEVVTDLAMPGSAPSDHGKKDASRRKKGATAGAELVTKGKELDAARATIKGLRVKNSLLENKLGEAEKRSSSKGEESLRVEELERSLGEERARVRGLEERLGRLGDEKEEIRRVDEVERARLRSKLEEVSRELRAKNDLLTSTASLTDEVNPPSRNNTSFVVPRLAEQVKALNAALAQKTLENAELLVRLGAGEG